MPIKRTGDLQGHCDRVPQKGAGDAIQQKGGSSDRQSLVVSIQAKLGRAPAFSQMLERRCCIYRVPELQRRVKEEAYTPVVVSIGPFHHGNERLLPMEAHKLMYLQSFIENSSHRDVNTYLDIISNKESQIRECYVELIDMPSKEFLMMTLTDSAFVIQILRTGKFVPPFTEGEVLHDLRLAENQLPFFILQDLYSAAFKPADNNMSFTRLACNFFKFEIKPISDEAASSCRHLLDLLRSLRLPSSETKLPDGVDATYVNPLPHTATSLYKGELKFEVNDSKECRLLDIDFNSDTLRIPKLSVEEGTESLFQNLIAFELCHYPPSHCYIVHYQVFMNRLINTEEDVQLLSKARIIHNWLTSDKKVLDMFNSLGTNVSWDHTRYSYANIANQLNERCKGS